RRTARLAGHGIPATGMEPEETAQAAAFIVGLSPGEQTLLIRVDQRATAGGPYPLAQVPRGRSGKSPARSHVPSATRGRSHPRCDAGGGRPAQLKARRPWRSAAAARGGVGHTAEEPVERQSRRNGPLPAEHLSVRAPKPAVPAL